ncbi:hypothetical protein [Granulicella sp. dw_53]|uniref:hypothetical protein n=1 Tax=Granulicella sp. dw_53 TaxID=2719792 RepID=UPI001BD2E1F3|nr:hypothetical protein [Granulicella sp. dw_53]
MSIQFRNKTLLRIISAALWLTVAPILNSQLVSGHPNPNSTTSPWFLPPSEKSDPEAIKVAQRAVEASGGMEAWDAVHAAKSRMSMSIWGKSNPAYLLMLDDWSTSMPRYRRGVVGTTIAPRNHDGQEDTDTTKHSMNVSQEFDQVRLLADHIPAAALQIALRRSEYILKLSTDNDCNERYRCFDVYRRLAGEGPYLREQHWILIPSTGLPDAVQLLPSNLHHQNNNIWEEVSYLGYTNSDGLLVPSQIAISFGNHHKQVLSLVAIAMDAAFDTQQFDQELKK